MPVPLPDPIELPNVDTSPKPTNIDDVTQAAYDAGFRGKALRIAVAIAFAESTHGGVVYDEHAIGDVNLTERGEMSVGWWQINYRPSRDKRDKVRDPVANLDGRTNARHAYAISGGGVNFRPWSTYNPGPNGETPAYKAHLASADGSADRIEKGQHADPSTGELAGGGVQMVDAGQPILAVTRRKTPVLPIRLGGKAAVGELGGRITGGSVDLTTQEASQLTLELLLDDLYATYYQLTEGTQLDYGALHFEVTGTSLKQGSSEQPQLTLKAQPPGTVRMRENAPKGQRNVSPTQYLAQMAADVGLHFLGEPTPRADAIGPSVVAGSQRLERAWEVAQRLAQQLGYLVFEAGGTLYFGSEPWLVQHARRIHLSVHGHKLTKLGTATLVDSIGYPSIDRARTSTPGGYDTNVNVTATVPREKGEAILPGGELAIAGCGNFDGPGHIITRVSWSLSDLVAPVTLSARTWQQPTPQASSGQPGTTIDDGTGEPVTGPIGKSKSALDFVTLCLRQVGDAYIYGVEVKLTDPNPGAFDCSELVQWATAQVGVNFPDGSGAQYLACKRAGKVISVAQAARTRGALLFRGNSSNPGADHVVVSLGDGKHTVEARGRAYGVIKGPIAGREWDAAGLIPGMRY